MEYSQINEPKQLDTKTRSSERPVSSEFVRRNPWSVRVAQRNRNRREKKKAVSLSVQIFTPHLSDLSS